MKRISRFFTLIAIFAFSHSILAQEKLELVDCSAKLENDVLTIENSRISRTYKWNNGNIITSSLTDKVSGKVWQMNSHKPDLIFPGESEKAENAVFETKIIPESAIADGCSILGNYANKRVQGMFITL